MFYSNKAAAKAPATAPTETTFLATAPVNCAGLPVGVPVGDAVPFPLVKVAIVKLAHVIRVLLEKWIAMDRFPKYEPRPLNVDAKSSEYDATNGSTWIFPFLPLRSPT